MARNSRSAVVRDRNEQFALLELTAMTIATGGANAPRPNRRSQPTTLIICKPMSLHIAFRGGPLDGSVMAAADQQPTTDVWLNLPRYVFRSTRHGRVGASFDIFNPRELPSAVPFGREIQLHQYRIDERHITDDATILIKTQYVGPTGRALPPTLQAISNWSGFAPSQ
ncbi:MAG: hypothetical protein C0485_09890 [Pirellula sp.]|nr:hypothetical protein [Pirellula sp.]